VRIVRRLPAKLKAKLRLKGTVAMTVHRFLAKTARDQSQTPLTRVGNSAGIVVSVVALAAATDPAEC
jgi:hypothetical protein